MKKTILLDFTGVYSEYKNKKDYTYVDCRDIKESDRYCSPESEKKIRERIKEFGTQGIHYLDCGNHHYITKLFCFSHSRYVQSDFSVIPQACG